MQKTTYSCDICHKDVTEGNAVGVEFRTEAGSRDKLKVGKFRDVHRHYCRNCLADLSHIIREVKEGKHDG